MADDEAPKSVENVEFKKPKFIGRIGKLPKRAENTNTDSSSRTHKDKKPPLNCKGFTYEDSAKSKTDSATNNNAKLPFAPFPYEEPKWSGPCPDGTEYALEVLKSGMIIERIDLTKQAFHVFGRLANSHILMTHPTISRHHAVLQFKAFTDDDPHQPPPGWYLYDLNSTHGTFHNGVRLKQEYFSRVRVGHQMKFGSSSRVYILMGPDYDCEGESDLTVTEIKEKAKQLKLQREKLIEEATVQKERDRLEAEKKREEQGIDWGMGEDAEEEPDLAENPYAVAANEELYLDDPKKTLRGYFEREGHELTYQCDARGVGQFVCKVELPLDDARGRPVVAEVIHRGKKKEAVIACALEACRILDRAGLLRQAKHESRRRKERDWSADDYYDSDEDTFLDRTGSVESKRTSRMRRGGALPEEPAAKTHEDLLKEIAELKRKISTEETALERLREGSKPAVEGSGGEDALDAYMSSLGRQGHTMAHKAEISNTKLTIQKLKAELSKAERLADLSRPAHAPPLVRKDDKKLIKMTNSVVYGKRIRLKDDVVKKPKVRKEVKAEETEFVEEMDSDEEKDSEDNKKLAETLSLETKKDIEEEVSESRIENIDKEDRLEVKEEREPVKMDTDIEESNDSSKTKKQDSNKSERKDVKRVFGPMRPPDNYVIPENYFDQETDRDLPEIEEKDVS